jgi:nitrogen fixation protein NifU and related proteins
MSEYDELYQQVILEHNKKPRNFEVLTSANHYALGKNPLCGDQFAVYLDLDESGIIQDISFQGTGCAISKASASMMTMNVKGKTMAEAEILLKEFQKMVTGQLDPERDENHLGKLKIFTGVKAYPVRVKCATLAWHALDAALSGQTQEITTEED